jgi:protein transport protein SEC24
MIELLTTYRKELAGGSVSGGGLQFPANLRGLPVLFLALIKNVGFLILFLSPAPLICFTRMLIVF